MEYFSSVTYEEIAVTAGQAVGLTAAKINKILPKGRVRIQVASFPIAFRTDGGTPTSATPQQMAVGDIAYIDDITEIKNFLAIGIGGTANIGVDYAAYVGSN